MNLTRVPTVAALLAGLLLSTACRPEQGTVCPAIGWLDALTVELAEGWAAVPGGSVTVECPSTCAGEFRLDASPVERDVVTVPLSGATTAVQFSADRPDSVVVTVTGADGTELARQPADLDWRRVGGSAECGGPMAATVVVPAP
jgi:hypothetical protein